MPPAPPMFSTITCRPKTSDKRALRMRPTMSVAPPATYGTTMVTGRVGQSCAKLFCEVEKSAAAPPARCRNLRRGSFIMTASACYWPRARMHRLARESNAGKLTLVDFSECLPAVGSNAAIKDGTPARPAGSLAVRLHQSRNWAEGHDRSWHLSDLGRCPT